MGHLEQLHSVGSGIVELIKLFEVRNQTSSGRDFCWIEEHQRNKKINQKAFRTSRIRIVRGNFMFYIVYGFHDTEYGMHNSKKPLFLLKQASSSAVPNPDIRPIFFWFPLPETSWHPLPRPPRLRGTMPSSPAPVVHIGQELGARRKTGAPAAGRARTPRMQGLRWFSRYVASKHGNKIPTFHQLYQNASNRVIRIFSINLETSHLR